MSDTNPTIVELTAEIVAAHVSHNKTSAAELPDLIAGIFAALSGAEAPAVPDAEPQKPAVPIRSSVKEDHIVCLEDGAKLKMLKRYLRTRFDMTPEDYRAKWGLPRDYPMVAPAYAAQRRTLAHAIGLGRKKQEVTDVVAPATAEKPAPKKPGRPRKAKTADASAS